LTGARNVDRRGYPDAVFDANDQLRGDRLKHVDSFLETANAAGGNNDPLIDGVSFAASDIAAVPEPASWAMMLLGFGAIGLTMRRRRKDSEAVSQFA
jgi:hypothetical protein